MSGSSPGFSLDVLHDAFPPPNHTPEMSGCSGAAGDEGGREQDVRVKRAPSNPANTIKNRFCAYTITLFAGNYRNIPASSPRPSANTTLIKSPVAAPRRPGWNVMVTVSPALSDLRLHPRSARIPVELASRSHCRRVPLASMASIPICTCGLLQTNSVTVAFTVVSFFASYINARPWCARAGTGIRMAPVATANMPNTQNFLRLRVMGPPINDVVNMKVRQILALCNPVRQVVQIRLVQRVCRQRNSHRSRISSDARFAVKCPTKCPDALGLGAIRRGNDLEGGIQMRKESVVSISVFIAALAFSVAGMAQVPVSIPAP